VLDGELVALEPTGRPNFNELQNHRHTSLPIFLIVFDILNFKQRDLLDRPLEERKKYLADLTDGLTAPIQQVMMFPDNVDLEAATQVVQQTRIEGTGRKAQRLVLSARERSRFLAEAPLQSRRQILHWRVHP
jgi:bifunctional non-homologous end joining protein LigD